MAQADHDAHIVFRDSPDAGERPGQTTVDLLGDGRAVSTCEIIPLTLHVGAATLRVDGIGGVGTVDEQRNRGYSRRVLTAAVARMVAGDAALSMLYGIPDFYPKFGYTAAGPDYTLVIPVRVPAPELPAGWQVQPLAPAHVAACHQLYERDAARAVGAVVRRPCTFPWSEMDKLARGATRRDECRVVLDPRGEVVAYAWRGTGFWAARDLVHRHRESLVLAEVVARDAPAADAILTACQRWTTDEARRRGRPVTNLLMSVPPEGPLASAAMLGTASFQQDFEATGEFMARVLDAGRLLRSLAPELGTRLGASLPSFEGTVTFSTDLGVVVVLVSRHGVAVDDSPHAAAEDAGTALVVHMPQTVLARLALGAFSTSDVLARLDRPPEGVLREVLLAMFPRRYPHISIPDRF